MKLKTPSLIIFSLISLALGTSGAWFFSTLESLSRTLKDLSSMFSLGTGLICAGIFIVILLRQIETNTSNPNSESQSP